jgi:hypothetical protein
MRNRLVVCIALGLALSSTAAFARGGMGGMGMSHMGSAPMGMGLAQTGMGSPPTGIGGGSFGTSPYAPGTNSLGTALPSSGIGKPIKGPLLGTSPAVDREEAKVEKMLGSICRGC